MILHCTLNILRTRVYHVEGMTHLYYYNCTTGDTTDSRMLLSNISLNLSVGVSKLQVAILARLSRDMPRQIIFNQSIFYVTHIIVGISHVIAFDILNPDRLFKMFPFKWKHWFLFSGMSELSKNRIFGSNSSQHSNKRFFLDIPTMTNSFYHRI